ncbi:MAG: response regulator transcription factor [Myxococcaceae bacterium]
MRVLIAEDEQRVRAFLRRGLEEEGFTVDEAAGGPRALELAHKEGLDAILLDWMIPAPSGLEVLTRLRAAGSLTPVIMVTARDALEDKVAALNAGADDYLVKPFAFDELLARLRAVLRRTERRSTPALTYEDLVLDPSTRSVTRAGVGIPLTAREFALLQFLMEHAEKVVTRTRIVEAVWEHDFETFSNVVEVYVRYLRLKIDKPFATKLIQTVRGVGYVLKAGPGE